MTRYSRIIIALLSILLTPFCFAKVITLYDQPNATAKTIGTIDSESGIIPIFTPKDNTWMKVADPKNGNVGWIKTSDLNQGKDSKGFTFTQKIISTGEGPKSYVIQFGVPQMLTPEQSQEFFKRLQQQQQTIQKDTQKMIQDMVNNWNQMDMHFPVFMPVIVMPNTTVPANANKNASTTKTQ